MTRREKQDLGTFVAIALVIACTIGLWPVVGAYAYSSGSRVGVVQKVSTKGLLWKTDEAELALEGFTIKGSGEGRAPSNVWDFTCRTPDVYAALQRALRNGHKVRVAYTQYVWALPWRGASDYLAESVDEL